MMLLDSFHNILWSALKFIVFSIRKIVNHIRYIFCIEIIKASFFFLLISSKHFGSVKKCFFCKLLLRWTILQIAFLRSEKIILYRSEQDL